MKACAGMAAALALAVSQPVTAGGSEPGEDNPEIAAIFAADQADRSSTEADWAAVKQRDGERLARIGEIDAAGAIRTAEDFHLAAVLFQHGEEPHHYLTAHVYATRAYNLGRRNANWLVASTLDRYLLSIDRPQLFGTQFELGEDGMAVPKSMDGAVNAETLRMALGISAELYEARRKLVEPYLQKFAELKKTSE